MSSRLLFFLYVEHSFRPLYTPHPHCSFFCFCILLSLSSSFDAHLFFPGRRLTDVIDSSFTGTNVCARLGEKRLLTAHEKPFALIALAGKEVFLSLPLRLSLYDEMKWEISFLSTFFFLLLLLLLLQWPQRLSNQCYYDYLPHQQTFLPAFFSVIIFLHLQRSKWSGEFF